jgi:DNA-directed RNA polymerase specialized sigma24 family protein
VQLRSERSRETAKRVVAEIWVLLNLALQKYARKHAHWGGALSADDISEIASQKASELLRRIDSKDWDPAGSSAAQLCGMLSTIARNGVVDLRRVRRREVSAPEGFDVPLSSRAWGGQPGVEESPESGVESAAYAQAIVDCAAGLSVRARRAWYLRVLYEIGSADIARDPAVATTPAGVDAMLARCREQMRSCLAAKGFDAGPLPPGTFVKLWELTHRDAPEATPPGEEEP